MSVSRLDRYISLVDGIEFKILFVKETRRKEKKNNKNGKLKEFQSTFHFMFLNNAIQYSGCQKMFEYTVTKMKKKNLETDVLPLHRLTLKL